jgi:hypothetical protein
VVTGVPAGVNNGLGNRIVPKEWIDVFLMVLNQNNKVSSFKVLAAAFQSIQAFWDVMLCGWIGG